MGDLIKYLLRIADGCFLMSRTHIPKKIPPHGGIFYFIGGKQSPPDRGQHANTVLLFNCLNISSPQHPNLFGFVPSAHRPALIFATRSSSVNSGMSSVSVVSSVVVGIGGKQSPPDSGQQLNPRSPMSVYVSPGQQPFSSGVSHVLSIGSVGASVSSFVVGAICARVAAMVRFERVPARF